MDLDKKLELLDEHGVDSLDAATVLINFAGKNDETLDFLAHELGIDFDDLEEDEDEDWSELRHIDSLENLTIHNLFAEVTHHDGSVRDVPGCVASPVRGAFGSAMKLTGELGSVLVELAPVEGWFRKYRVCFEPLDELGNVDEWGVNDADSMTDTVQALYEWAQATVRA